MNVQGTGNQVLLGCKTHKMWILKTKYKEKKNKRKKEKNIVGAIFYERKKIVGYVIFTVTCYPQKR